MRKFKLPSNWCYLAFKRIVRRSKNFVNVCHTLAHSHQELQACLLETELFSPDLRFVSYASSSYSAEVTSFFNSCGFDLNCSQFVEKVVFKGKLYQLDEFVVLETRENDPALGKIIAMILSASKLYLNVQCYVATFQHDLGCYSVDVMCTNGQMKCVEINCTIDRLRVYRIGLRMLACLQHMIV